MSLKQKFVFNFFLILAALLSGFWFLSHQLLQRTIAQQTAIFAQTLAKQTADSVTELVLANDLLGLNVVLGQLAQEPGFVSATITDVDKHVLASTLPPDQLPPTTGHVFTAPITLQDSVAGQVIFEFDDSLVERPLSQLLAYYGSTLGIGLVLVLLVTWRLTGHITNRLDLLLSQTESVEMGDETATITVDGEDEIGQVQQKVADLLDRSLELEDQIAVTGVPEVDQSDSPHHRPERRMASFLAVEIVNSGAAVELLHPTTLSTLLQQYQFYLRQAARLYRGVLTQITGDKAIVSFDVRQCQDEHAFNALCCGQLFLQLMQTLSDEQRSKSGQALEFHLAAHSGDVFFSPPWKSAKQEKDSTRPETMIGATVALVQELLTHADSNKILVSELSYDLANGNLRFPVEPGQSVQTDKRTILTYSVPAHCGAHNDLLERQRQHLLPEAAKAHDPIPTLSPMQ
jgi:membrane protein